MFEDFYDLPEKKQSLQFLHLFSKDYHINNYSIVYIAGWTDWQTF